MQSIDSWTRMALQTSLSPLPSHQSVKLLSTPAALHVEGLMLVMRRIRMIHSHSKDPPQAATVLQVCEIAN